jgi:hypothetical protein
MPGSCVMVKLEDADDIVPMLRPEFKPEDCSVRPGKSIGPSSCDGCATTGSEVYEAKQHQTKVCSRRRESILSCWQTLRRREAGRTHSKKQSSEFPT